MKLCCHLSGIQVKVPRISVNNFVTLGSSLIHPKMSTHMVQSRSVNNFWSKKSKLKKKIRPLDVLNQILSRSKRIKSNENTFQTHNLIKTNNSENFIAKKNKENLKDKAKFSQIGQAYMSEYSKFQYKVDTIVNDAYLYVRELQPSMRSTTTKHTRNLGSSIY